MSWNVIEKDFHHMASGSSRNVDFNSPSQLTGLSMMGQESDRLPFSTCGVGKREKLLTANGDVRVSNYLRQNII